MKIVALLLGSCVLLGSLAFGQAPGEVAGVSAEILISHDEYLPGEEIKVGVRITNRSGQAISLGQDDAWLKFSIEGKDKRAIPQTGLIPLAGAFSLASAKRGTKFVSLTPYFGLREPGRYSVTASMQLPSWSDTIKAPAKSFDITPGIVIKSVEFGVPPVNGQSAAQPETRRYVLQRLDRQGRITIYCSITDAAASRVYESLPLCDAPNSSRPEIQIDQHSNAHILVQTGVKQATYCEVNFVGLFLARQTYRYGGVLPQLSVDPLGRIIVTGGERVISPADLPPPETLPSDSANVAPANQ